MNCNLYLAPAATSLTEYDLAEMLAGRLRRVGHQLHRLRNCCSWESCPRSERRAPIALCQANPSLVISTEDQVTGASIDKHARIVRHWSSSAIRESLAASVPKFPRTGTCLCLSIP